MLDIVYITDEYYAMPTCISIVSLFRNNPGKEMRVYVIADNLSETSENILKGLSRDSFRLEILYDPDIMRTPLPERALSGKLIRKNALLKFAIPNILNDLQKVLYLDGDTIVQNDISSLFEMDISDYYLAAADDMGDKRTGAGMSLYACRIGIQAKHYFNSGVMLMNLVKMRADNIPEKLLKYRTNNNTHFMD